MNRFNRFALILASLTFVLALASCGGDDGSGESAEPEAAEEAEGGEGGAEVPASEADTTVGATLGEFFIKLDTDAVDAGNIQFKVTNDGQLEHEFVVIATDIPAGDLPLADGDVDEGGAGEVPGEIESVQPGATEEITLSLKASKYALICNLPGHYKAGQYIEFAVD